MWKLLFTVRDWLICEWILFGLSSLLSSSSSSSSSSAQKSLIFDCWELIWLEFEGICRRDDGFSGSIRLLLTIFARSFALAVSFSVVARNCALITLICLSVNWFWLEFNVDDGERTCFFVWRYSANERTFRFFWSSVVWDSFSSRFISVDWLTSVVNCGGILSIGFDRDMSNFLWCHFCNKCRAVEL